MPDPALSPRIVILAPNWLGDAVMALPAIADVRRAAPGSRIVAAARPAVAPLFDLAAGIDETMAADRLRGRAFDLAILLPNSFHAALAAFRAQIPERWGYRTDWRAPLLTRAVAPPRGLHQVDYYRKLIGGLGMATASDEPHLDVRDDMREAGAALLREAGWSGSSPLVAIAPGAAYGGAKRWPPEHFAELVDALAADGVVSVMVGGAADAAAGREVEAAARTPRALVNLIGRTNLAALAGVLVHVRTLVTNDSGAMHVGAAVGVPITALFGPTREWETAPRSLRSDHLVLTNRVWCRPCMLRECPLDHRCLRGVTPGRVAEAARRAL